MSTGKSTRQGSERSSKRSSRKGGWTFIGISGRAALTVIVVLLTLSYLSYVINPAKAWFFSIFGMLFFPLLLLDIIFLVWALKRRSRTAIVAFLILIPSVFYLSGYVRLPRGNYPAEPAEGAETLKVVSYNVGRFNQSSKKFTGPTRAACADSVMNFLAAQDADIICLQEVYIPAAVSASGWLSRHIKGYEADYFFYGRGRKYGNVTLSRLKASNKGVIKFENSSNLAIFTDYSYGGEVFRVYNCHFESYNISTSGVLKALTRRDQDELKNTAQKMKRGITHRPDQVNQVFDHIADCPVGAIVCGDFNDTPMSYTYFKMSRQRTDTFRAAGEGFGATFVPFWPFIRIDYVLIPDMFRALSHATLRKPYSDHYPVISTLEFVPEAVPPAIR